MSPRTQSGIQLIVGLGNPGADYENTRHNAGAWFVSDLAKASRTTLRPVSRFHGLHGTAHLHGHDIHLLIPQTFMNLSGQSVGALASYYKIPPEAILVAHDEIDLPAGVIRLKHDGGHGGHNGLRDMITHLHSRQFYRLRIGVGHPGNSKDVVDYVLKPPTKSEREDIYSAIQTAEMILPDLLGGHFQKAMQHLHTRG
ncbi:MAG TPA: aminoacyl-tRNA hydrolase [Gammaproteobacteria bacterium]|nr:aminoacyl-tRNA hydrolase [Gammaproteobacteria bacterium]